MNRAYSAPTIDYALLSAAESFYKSLGYKSATLPWVIGYEAYSFNKNEHPNYEDCYTNGGYLVASAEQAFIEKMLEGNNFDKHYSITPCFRDDDYDETHYACFIKLELIQQLSPGSNSASVLSNVIADAKQFFSQYLVIDVVKFDDGTFDINDRQTGLELGSYGVRQFKNVQWVYGTGCALPRLNLALGETNE